MLAKLLLFFDIVKYSPNINIFGDYIHRLNIFTIFGIIIFIISIWLVE